MTPSAPDPAGRPASYSRVSLAMMTSPTEANLLGNVHGGDVMKLADSTAGAVAHRHSGGPAVTAAMDERWPTSSPVHVGDIVRTYGQVNWTGRSSMEIGVRVEAQPWRYAASARPRSGVRTGWPARRHRRRPRERRLTAQSARRTAL